MSKVKGKEHEVREQIVDIKQRLRLAGLRSTPARIAVVQALQKSGTPLTHAEVAAKLESIGVDKATVLRNLSDLVSAGLARRTELGDRLWRYELLGPGGIDDAHPHFLCLDCGAVKCLDDVELTTASRRNSAAVGAITEILLKGHCIACQETALS